MSEPGPALTSERLLLVPLVAADADEMVEVLGDERLHEFIGGHPADLAALRHRYAMLVAGSGNPHERWLNWIVRLGVDGRAIGTVQATIVEQDSRLAADVAWVIGVPWQGRGYASEAARTLVEWLRGEGIERIEAHVHPDHHASAAVAANVGLEPTDEEVDGERVWRWP